MTVLFETWTVTIAYEWEKKFNEQGNGSRYTFASFKGCEEWVKEQIARGESNPENKVLWYSIEGLQHIPCDENKPWGQTYQGMKYHNFVDFEREEEM